MASDTADSRAHCEQVDADVPDLSTSESEPTSSGDTDSEDASSKVAAPDTSPQTSMYSLLAGESDNELEEQEDFCEETISLLAHEILCCEGDSDSEAESDGEDIDEARDNDRLREILEFGLHNPYRPMLSDEDEDNPNEETIFLLDEDQQSEEKSDSSKRSF
ncbi:serine-aspartate repeat-containing protein C [Drosophila teissieri]|uniref:serine-aspartate repeat-containing protein C n=1 Tax=Drosophila teissieri TaxID=7243 RepID=UPI001CBA4E8E|nr:serine-aspartate repeat-containing protein C [Drosophila teissieri]